MKLVSKTGMDVNRSWAVGSWYNNTQIEQEPKRYFSVFSGKSKLHKARVHVVQSEKKISQGIELEDERCLTQ